MIIGHKFGNVIIKVKLYVHSIAANVKTVILRRLSCLSADNCLDSQLISVLVKGVVAGGV